MSRWINTDQLFLPVLAQALDCVPTVNARVVSEFDDTVPVAAVLFDGYNGHSVYVHIWISPGRMPSRMFWFAVFDYCWRQLGCKVAVGTVPSVNTKASELDKHLGFVVNSTIPNFFGDGNDMVIMVATPDTIPDWSKWRPKKFVSN